MHTRAGQVGHCRIEQLVPTRCGHRLRRGITSPCGSAVTVTVSPTFGARTATVEDLHPRKSTRKSHRGDSSGGRQDSASGPGIMRHSTAGGRLWSGVHCQGGGGRGAVASSSGPARKPAGGSGCRSGEAGEARTRSDSDLVHPPATGGTRKCHRKNTLRGSVTGRTGARAFFAGGDAVVRPARTGRARRGARVGIDSEHPARRCRQN